MILKTIALVLRVIPYSNTSQIVTWMTEGRGRVTTLVKGACRPKSQFLGQYDLFYSCELLYYAREKSALQVAKECTPLVTRDALRSDWRSACTASYFSHLVQIATMDRDQQQPLYALLVESFDYLCGRRTSSALILWFELSLLSHLGLEPAVTRCPQCQDALPSGRPLAFSPAAGGILCANCTPTAGTETIRPDTLAILRRLSSLGSPRSAAAVHLNSKQDLELRRLIGVFFQYHLAALPESRTIAFSTACIPEPTS